MAPNESVGNVLICNGNLQVDIRNKCRQLLILRVNNIYLFKGNSNETNNRNT